MIPLTKEQSDSIVAWMVEQNEFTDSDIISSFQEAFPPFEEKIPKEGSYTLVNGMGNGFIQKWNNGILVSENLYCDGKMHGEQKEWFLSGSLKELIPYKNGEIDGVYQRFHLNSLTKEQSDYINNRLEGYSRRWHENGVLSVEIFYKKDKANYCRQWDEQGNLIKIIPYFDDIINGMKKTVFYEGTQKCLFCNYKKSLPSGISLTITHVPPTILNHLDDKL